MNVTRLIINISLLITAIVCGSYASADETKAESEKTTATGNAQSSDLASQTTSEWENWGDWANSTESGHESALGIKGSAAEQLSEIDNSRLTDYDNNESAIDQEKQQDLKHNMRQIRRLEEELLDDLIN